MSAGRNFGADSARAEGGPDIRGMSTEINIFEASRPANVVFLRDARYADIRCAADARKKREARLFIEEEGDITVVNILDMIGGTGIWSGDILPLLRQIDGPGKKVEFRINSGGGDAWEGVTIANGVRWMQADTTAVIYGLAASAASLIAIAAKTVVMPRNAQMMIHRAWMLAIGTGAELRKGAQLLDKLDTQMIGDYCDRASDADPAEITRLVDEETYLTGEEAVALGLADILLDEVRTAACASLDVFASEIPDGVADLLAGPAAEDPVAEIQDAPAIDADAEPKTPAAPDDQEQAPAEILPKTTQEAELLEPTEPETPAEPEGLSIEAQAEIRTACAVFSMADKADEFIANRTSFDDVRIALWNARAEASARTEIDPRVSPVVEGPKPAAEGGRKSGTPTALQRANAAHSGRIL